MDKVLASAMRKAVHDRLNYLDALVTDGDAYTRRSVTASELPRLTAAWRALLAVHAPNRRGRCPNCSGWLRPRAHPCSTWTVAHHHLLTTPEAASPRHFPAASEAMVSS